MLGHAASEEDQATAVTPDVIPASPWRAESVQVLDGYAVFVRFKDGSAGTVYMRGLIESDRAGVFAALREPAVFAQAQVVLGAVTWPGEIDLAPDAMHDQISQYGHWVIAAPG